MKKKQNFIEDNLLIVSKQTIEKFLKDKDYLGLTGLYLFLYNTAKWQKTNQPRATISYIAKGIKCCESKVRRLKRKLIKLGLIEDIKQVDPVTQQIKGWYVKINYLWKKETVKEALKSHPVKNCKGGNEKASLSVFHYGGKIHPNALSDTKLNALSDDNIYINILKFWNQQNIIKHEKLTTAMKNQLCISLKKYSVEDIQGGISHLATILNDTKYFYSTYWDLSEFLKSQKGLAAFLNEGKQWKSFSKWQEKQPEEVIELNEDGTVKKNDMHGKIKTDWS